MIESVGPNPGGRASDGAIHPRSALDLPSRANRTDLDSGAATRPLRLRDRTRFRGLRLEDRPAEQPADRTENDVDAYADEVE